MNSKIHKSIKFLEKCIGIMFILLIINYTCVENLAYAIDTNQQLTSKEEFKYEEIDGQIAITQFIGTSKDIVIPQVIDNKKVVSIGDTAFMDCKEIKSIILPEGVKNIGFRTFRGCSSLVTISIPDSVNKINAEAFDECSRIVNISIPSNVTMIENFAFAECTSLETVSIPKGVVYIGDYAFRGCSNLNSIAVPSGIKSMGMDVFYGCSQLTDVKIIDVGENPMIKISKDGHVDTKVLKKIFDKDIDEIKVTKVQPEEIENELAKAQEPSVESSEIGEIKESTVTTDTGARENIGNSDYVNNEVASNANKNKSSSVKVASIIIIIVIVFFIGFKIIRNKRRKKIE